MRVFITGLTGTLGTALAKLHHGRGDLVWGCSRSESRAVEWLKDNYKLATLFLTDAASLADRLSDVGRLLPTMGKVYHCAAMKHVEMCETNPWDAITQNVSLVSAVVGSCSQAKVPLTLVSSDKACLPLGVYGATKLLAERIALREGASVIRLGNIVGSSGSVFSKWKSAVRQGRPIEVTDRNMTRYFIGVDEAARFVAGESEPGAVVTPWPMKSVRMGNVVEAVAGYSGKIEEVGRRPGETLHQWLVAPEEGYRVESGRLVLTGTVDELDRVGKCSATDPRWDVNELLELAGVRL